MNAADIIGGTIQAIECKAGDRPEREDSYDVRDVWFYVIVTDKGRADVILHVDHNGYYGGCLEAPVQVDSIPDDAHTPEP